MANAPADWIKSAVKITAGFETAGDPYMGVSGDFDGMGISCGVLQWNIGQASLQPMVKAVGQAVVSAAMPVNGAEMWSACTGSITSGLAIVRGWQAGAELKPGPKAELRALMGTPQMRAEQDKVIAGVAASAYKQATDWAAAGGAAPTKRLFCWFFDVLTQNGGLEGLTPAAVASFIATNTPEKADDLICDFLAEVAGTGGHAKDARANATLWRDQAAGEKLPILCMSYLRSKTALPKWRHVVINRKGAIAMGKGRVNSSLWDFSGEGL